VAPCAGVGFGELRCLPPGRTGVGDSLEPEAISLSAAANGGPTAFALLPEPGGLGLGGGRVLFPVGGMMFSTEKC
jgi:hypothetical protein